jgi:hypothetical protein
LIISWRTPKSLSSLAPSYPAKGNYGHEEIDGLKDGNNAGVEWSGDVEPQCNESWIGNNIGLLHLSCLFACHLQCN